MRLPAFCRLYYGTASDGKLGRGLGTAISGYHDDYLEA